MLSALDTETALGIRDPRDKLLLALHPGDAEVYRTLAKIQGYKAINTLMFSESAQRSEQIMQKMAPQVDINLIPVTDIDPEIAILLKERLDNGEWVAVIGDRIAITPQRGSDWRVCRGPFMG